MRAKTKFQPRSNVTHYCNTTNHRVKFYIRSNKIQDQFYELTVEKNHLSIIIKALSNYICSQYEGIDAEVVDVPKTMENIKIASDMQLVLKHHLGGVQHSPKQTAETTGLVWIRDVDVEDMFSQHND